VVEGFDVDRLKPALRSEVTDMLAGNVGIMLELSCDILQTSALADRPSDRNPNTGRRDIANDRVTGRREPAADARIDDLK
jgi:hypothetical protein